MPFFWEDVCARMEDDNFRHYFWMNKETFRSLVMYLSPARCLYQGGREQVERSKSVAMTLCFLGTRLPFKQLSIMFGVSEECFIRTTDYVMQLLNDKSKLLIKWPEKDEYPAIAAEFNKSRKRKFPNIIGATDGCHIRIQPKNNERTPYYNFKKFHSIHLQAVCTADRKFTDIFVG